MKALVIGGTGPTGPFAVESLLQRGYNVAIFHSGRHEVTFSSQVEHIHGDPHFEDTIRDALGAREFDLTLAMYGRTRHLADALARRTERFIAITGAAGYRRPDDKDAWGPMGLTMMQDENGPWQVTKDPSYSFHYQLHTTKEEVLKHHAAGDFNASLLRPPNMYGPRQIGPEDWSIVRRVLDKRPFIILGDGGLKIDARIYTENFAHAMDLVIDEPEKSAGKRYNVRDEAVYTMRQRVELIAASLGHEFEIISLPYELALPCHPLYRRSQSHAFVSDLLIRQELGYVDTYTAAEGMVATAKWLLENPLAPGSEGEQQLGDPFDYDAEDEIVAAWRNAREALESIPYDLPPLAHRYRHPRERHEDWSRPSGESGYKPG